MSNYTYEQQNNATLIKEDDYEAVIERIEKRRTPNGKEKLSLMFRINPDVEQPFQNRVVFEDIWTERENPGVYNRKRINQLLGTQKNIKDGQVFETIEDIIDFLLGANIVLHITVELDTYRGEDVNNIAYYKSSKVQPKELGSGTPAKEKPVETKKPETGFEDEDDLPF